MRTRSMIRLDAFLGLPLCALAFALSLPGRLLGRPPATGRRGPKRILVVKFLGLGSVLLATPMLRRLRSVYPAARITFLTFEANAGLIRRLSCVDDVIAVEPRSLPGLLAATPRLLLRLRRRRFDLAMDLEFYSRLSSLVTWGSGARRRVGFFVRARWRGSLLTDPVYFNPTLPYGQAVMALLRPLGVAPDDDLALVRPIISRAEQEQAWRRLVTLGVPQDGAIVAVNASASDLCVERRWPGDRFARLVERFDSEIARVDRLVFIGTAADGPVVADVLARVGEEARPRCLDLSGRTSLVELMVLLSHASVLVTNDGGPMHLAASLGVPTISFFGPETPALYGPVGKQHEVFYVGHWCSPCLSVYNAKIAMCNGENECMRRIELDDVVRRASVFCRERVGLAPPKEHARSGVSAPPRATAVGEGAQEPRR